MPVEPLTLNSANDCSSARLGQTRLPSQHAMKPRGTEMIAGFASVMGGWAPGQTPGLSTMSTIVDTPPAIMPAMAPPVEKRRQYMARTSTGKFVLAAIA